ncbi:MAG: ornithine cyclodeaminase family protein [Sneathiellales bacterium]|nr:ornithine cyclodeaminase family protein [Sneathiellales bacterium]
MIQISADEINKHLPMDKAIKIVRDVMIRVSDGKAELPLRTVMDIDGTNKLGVMPGALKDPSLYGVKVLSLFPGNPAKGLSSHIGAVLMFDTETGKPAAFLDADAITAIRTAAATAAATNALARKDASSLTIIGTGEQAETHLKAINEVRALRSVTFVGRSKEKAEKLIRHLEGDYPDIRFSASDHTQSAVADADIVCTVTSSATIVLQGSWIKPGTHVNAVGASVPVMQEIDEELVLKSRLYVDYKPSALAQAKEIITALETGAMNESHILGEIGSLYKGGLAGRDSDEEITLYRSLGIAAQDLTCADFVMKSVQS